MPIISIGRLSGGGTTQNNRRRQTDDSSATFGHRKLRIRHYLFFSRGLFVFLLRLAGSHNDSWVLSWICGLRNMNLHKVLFCWTLYFDIWTFHVTLITPSASAKCLARRIYKIDFWRVKCFDSNDNIATHRYLEYLLDVYRHQQRRRRHRSRTFLFSVRS